MVAPSDQIKYVVSGGYMTVTFVSHNVLDRSVTSAIGQEARAAVEEHKPRILIVDFSAVRHVSSQMLSQLLQLHKFMQSRQGELRIAAFSPDALNAFKLCRFDKLIRYFDTQQAALAEP